jgi:hypothetical protein
MADFDSVGTIAFFRERNRVESELTRKVLSAMTPQMLAYRPHPASSTVGTTAWTIIRGLHICNQLVRSVTCEVPPGSPPGYQEILGDLETESLMLTGGLLGMSQLQWTEERTVTANGRVLLQQPLGQIFWLFHVDAIHHRGQISTYLRGFGAKVPSIYGPSGDSPA